MSPVPPPDPPEYGPSKPARGREDTGIGRGRDDHGLRTAVDSLQASIDEVLALYRGREQRSDVRQTDSTIMRERIEQFIEWEKDWRKKEAADVARRSRVKKIVTLAATVVTALVLGVWRGCEMSKPEPPTIETVKQTIEERTSELEKNEKKTTERLTAVESQGEAILQAVRHLGTKIDAANAPPPEPVEPRSQRSKRPR